MSSSMNYLSRICLKDMAEGNVFFVPGEAFRASVYRKCRDWRYYSQLVGRIVRVKLRLHVQHKHTLVFQCHTQPLAGEDVSERFP